MPRGYRPVTTSSTVLTRRCADARTRASNSTISNADATEELGKIDSFLFQKCDSEDLRNAGPLAPLERSLI